MSKQKHKLIHQSPELRHAEACAQAKSAFRRIPGFARGMRKADTEAARLKKLENEQRAAWKAKYHAIARKLSLREIARARVNGDSDVLNREIRETEKRKRERSAHFWRVGQLARELEIIVPSGKPMTSHEFRRAYKLRFKIDIDGSQLKRECAKHGITLLWPQGRPKKSD